MNWKINIKKTLKKILYCHDIAMSILYHKIIYLSLREGVQFDSEIKKNPYYLVAIKVT